MFWFGREILHTERGLAASARSALRRGPAQEDLPWLHERSARAVPNTNGGRLGPRSARRFLQASEPLDHWREVGDISNAEVRDTPAITAGQEVLSDLIMGPEGQKWSGESVFDAQTAA